jgi:hypothetical protein
MLMCWLNVEIEVSGSFPLFLIVFACDSYNSNATYRYLLMNVTSKQQPDMSSFCSLLLAIKVVDKMFIVRAFMHVDKDSVN